MICNLEVVGSNPTRGSIKKCRYRHFFFLFPYLQKTRCLLRFHNAVSVGRGQHALQTLALVVVSVRVFHTVAHACAYGTTTFCLVFSKRFNIMSALSVHQSLTLPQKIDSRGGLFWCKKRLACACGKMNFYLNWPPLTPVFGWFIAKWSAFWCKTRCNMPLNTVRFGAKCSAFWC